MFELIVVRPEQGERRTPDSGELCPTGGLIGDNWRTRGSRHTQDGSTHPGMQQKELVTRFRLDAAPRGQREGGPTRPDRGRRHRPQSRPL